MLFIMAVPDSRQPLRLVFREDVEDLGVGVDGTDAYPGEQGEVVRRRSLPQPGVVLPGVLDLQGGRSILRIAVSSDK